MRVGPDVPRMAFRFLGEEIVAVPKKDAWSVRLKQGVEHDLRDLTHAANGFALEVL